jgi:hypothetical protein
MTFFFSFTFNSCHYVTCLATTQPGGATGGRAWAAQNSRGGGGGGSSSSGGGGGGDLGDSDWTDGAAIVVSGSRDTTVVGAVQVEFS